MTASINSKSERTHRSLTAEQQVKVASLKASLGEVDSLVQRVQLRELLVDDSINSARATIQTARKEVASATKALLVSGAVLAVGSAAACLTVAQAGPVSGEVAGLSDQGGASMVAARESVAAAGGAPSNFRSEKTETVNIEKPSAHQSSGSEKGMSASKLRRALGQNISGGDGRCAGEPQGRDRDSLSGSADLGSYKDGAPRTDWSQDPRWETVREKRSLADEHERAAMGYSDDSTEAYGRNRFFEALDRNKDVCRENGEARSLRTEAGALERDIERDANRERGEHGECVIC